MAKERKYLFYLEDMSEAMGKIAEYITDMDFESFKRDYKTVDAVIRNLEVIGEASRKVPQEIKELQSEIPWQEMYYLRNKVSHEYFGIDYEIIWDVVSNHLPQNRIQIEALIESVSPK